MSTFPIFFWMEATEVGKDRYMNMTPSPSSTDRPQTQTQTQDQTQTRSTRCDEAKPRCRNCIEKNFHCEYGPQVTFLTKNAHTVAPAEIQSSGASSARAVYDVIRDLTDDLLMQFVSEDPQKRYSLDAVESLSPSETGGTCSSQLDRGDPSDKATTTPVADGSDRSRVSREHSSQNKNQHQHQNQDQNPDLDPQERRDNLHYDTTTTTTTSIPLWIPDTNEDSVAEKGPEKGHSDTQNTPRTTSHHYHSTTAFSDRDEFAVRGLLALGTTGMMETQAETRTQSSMMMGSQSSHRIDSSSSAGNDRSGRGVYQQQQQQQQKQHKDQSQQEKANRSSRDNSNFPLSPAPATTSTNLSNDLNSSTTTNNNNVTISQKRESRTLDLLRHYRYEVAPWLDICDLSHTFGITAVQIAMDTTSATATATTTTTGTGFSISTSKANSNAILASLLVLSETSLNLLHDHAVAVSGPGAHENRTSGSATGYGTLDPCSTGTVTDTLGNDTLLNPNNNNDDYRSTAGLNTDPAINTDTDMTMTMDNNIATAVLLTALRKVQSFIADIPRFWRRADATADATADAGADPGYNAKLMDALAMHASSGRRDIASAVYWLFLRLAWTMATGLFLLMATSLDVSVALASNTPVKVPLPMSFPLSPSLDYIEDIYARLFHFTHLPLLLCAHALLWCNADTDSAGTPLDSWMQLVDELERWYRTRPQEFQPMLELDAGNFPVVLFTNGAGREQRGLRTRVSSPRSCLRCGMPSASVALRCTMIAASAGT
ncbi:hypothetical protein T310_0243 [Rasamsonia emersonii CBS 393.64]|uniref:Zn(2)-C6 fungal-type domain-containing protein n=1 Tax=Rasamsonia emersonii (strain ATCC 16479 / CBS 393.64 / IMI 116815) TaxID=1408163 RepID=A0A0F4Z5B4_RASE3|nr:hypothetical protein T310_0243 [Rasamsonia emersonii CBS 393.64]KKA25687.1 hypothetical protein T310_0243 [Rasamsonia emersonii CBS 393.64]